MTRAGWNPTYCVCVCLCGCGEKAGLDCRSGAGVTRCLTNTAALTGPAAALKTVTVLGQFSCLCACVCNCASALVL